MRNLASTAVLALASLPSLVAAIEPARRPQQPLGNGTKRLTFNDTILSPKFRSTSLSVAWSPGGHDGQYVFTDEAGGLVLVDVVTNETEVFISADQVPTGYVEYQIRNDMARAMFSTNHTKQYRHSYFADYFILEVASGQTMPLVEDQAGDIQYAEFAPTGDAIVFVRGNNLFLNVNGTITQITHDGGPDMFHAVPDWVYEEEMYGARSTLWFSPDASVVAFFSFNETGVGTFTVPHFMNSQETSPRYPRNLELRYPKAGTKNPTVSLRLLSVESGHLQQLPIDAFPVDDMVVGGLVWTTQNSSAFVYTVFNRVQDQARKVLVDLEKNLSAVVRERDGSDGYIEVETMTYVGSVNGSGDYYIEVSDESGWYHVFLYPVAGGEAVALTGGEWEVISIVKVDTGRQLVYYTSGEHDSTESHLYSVSYSTREKKALVDESVAGYWSASFSPGGGFYILSYQGPDVPYQESYSINDTTTPLGTITSNQALWDRLQEYSLPNITYFTLERPELNISLNVMQRLPPNLDPSKRYPVLFIPYGGPGAQEVTKKYQSLNNIRAYVASEPELEYITYTVDGRGTGAQGRAFRSTVVSRLGTLEAEDQIWAAEQLAARFSYMDPDKVAIFGWSFGGFLSAKVVEADSGVFSMALIVAPVSDWRFYDSIYTERYMKMPAANEAGYNRTAVTNTDGFKHIAGGFTVQHGIADDNVHYQNAAALIDRLVGAGVSPVKLDWRAYTDSDHNINYHGATVYLYKWLVELLYREKERTGGELRHQWSRRAVHTSLRAQRK